VASHVVRLACERPDLLGRSLAHWDGHALARPRIAEGSRGDLSAATVRRRLAVHHLQPGRHPLWLHPTPPRAATFSASMMALSALYPRPLQDAELVRAMAAKTSLQPSPRLAPTLPAPPQNIAHRHEPADQRAGALQLVAAFDTRSGRV